MTKFRRPTVKILYATAYMDWRATSSASCTEILRKPTGAQLEALVKQALA